MEFCEISAGPELIEELIGDHQVGKRRAQDFAVDVDLRGLRFGGAVVVLQGHRSGAGVLADLKALAGQHLAGLRQREVIVVAEHALHFHQLLLAHVIEDDVQNGNGQLQRVAQALQVAIPFQQQPPQDEIEHQRLGNA